MSEFTILINLRSKWFQCYTTGLSPPLDRRRRINPGGTELWRGHINADSTDRKGAAMTPFQSPKTDTHKCFYHKFIKLTVVTN